MGILDDLWDWYEGARDATLDALAPVMEALGFESERVYSYAMAASRLISDEDIPTESHLIGSIIRAIRNDESIAAAILFASTAGPKQTVRSYMAYGENGYIYGLPTMGFKSPPMHMSTFVGMTDSTLITLDYTPVFNIVGHDESGPIHSTLIDHCEIKVPTAYDWGLAYLQENHGYKNSMDIAGETYVFTEMDISPGIFRAKLVRYEVVGVPIIEYIDVPDQTDSEYQVYYQFACTVQDSVGTRFRYAYLFPFNYAGENNDHPELLGSGTGNPSNTDLTKTLPVAILKRDSVYNLPSSDAIAADPNANPPIEAVPAVVEAEYYASTKQLLRRLAFSLDDFVASLQESEDMANVPDAFMVFAVTPYSETPATLRYLYMYFGIMHDAMAEDSYLIYSSMHSDIAVNLIKFEEQNYNASLMFNYIRREYIAGSIGEVGELIREFDIRPEMMKQVGQKTKLSNTSSLIFKRQINATTYEKLTINGLMMLSTIKSTDGNIHGQLNRLVEQSDETGKNFIIPLTYMFLRMCDDHSVEKLLYESMHLVFFAATYQDLEWHETAYFNYMLNGLIQMAGYATMVYSLVTGGATQVLVNMIIALMLKEILESANLNTEFAVMAAIAYAYVMSSQGDSSRLTSGLADKILLGVSAFSEVIITDSNIKMDRLADERAENQELYETEQARLQSIQDGLDSDPSIDLMYLTSTQHVQYEGVGGFYARTLMTTTTELCMSIPDTFVESKLDLDSLTI